MLTEKFFAVAQLGHEFTLWLLIVLSVISVAFILERWVILKSVRKKGDRIIDQAQDTILGNDLSEVEAISRDKSSVEGRALNCGMKHIGSHGANGLEELFGSYAMMERPKLEARLNFLATVGSNAPFIGLLGTVLGIMDALKTLANSQGDPGPVMVGISQALVATAVGLLVAIPAVVAYNYFQKQVKRTMQNLESIKDLCLAFAKTKKEA
jgi:biopolymer transport protein ExbB